MLGRTKLKEMMNRHEPIISCMLRFPVAAHVEILALAGVNLIIIDNEHYPFDPETMIDLIRAADCHGAAIMVRVPNPEPTRIAQIMDMGADGVWIPTTSSVEEAQALVDAVKFPPIGKRGFCPITRANSYGQSGMTPSEFAAWSNENSVVMVQIENKEGFEAMDDIFAIPEIDCVEYGPSDLAASYGKPGHNNDPDIVEKVEEIKRRAKAAGKNVSVMCYSQEEIIKALESGITHISLGSDQQMQAFQIKALVGEVKKAQ